jgi:hypothetical protein
MPLACLAALTMASPSAALTLGTATPPAGATPTKCTPVPPETGEVVQTASLGGYSYVVPAGGGDITSWSFDTTGATAGTPYGLVIAQPIGSGYQVAGSDIESVPASLPPVATFQLASAIPVQAGDLIGVAVPPGFAADCQFTGAPSGDDLTVFTGATTPGTTLATVAPVSDDLANVSATMVQNDDVGVTEHVLPSSITAGGDSVFALAVSGSVPTAPVTVTDAVPAGLKVAYASAGSGSCTTAGQTVSCDLNGTPSTVTIVVSAASAASAGRYTDTAFASSQLTDPNEANNTATAKLTVAKSQLAACRPVKLSDVPLAEAKSVLRALGCSVGKITHKSSGSVPKGDVISTTPRSGTEPLGKKVQIVVSSGRKKRR